MTTTLQEALIKAGLVKKEKLDKSQREKKLGRREGRKVPGFVEGKHHHHLRIECEQCKKSLPDVEYYEHRNQILPKWLCVECADRHQINDKFRQTVQSQHAQSGLFCRQYGPTKVFK